MKEIKDKKIYKVRFRSDYDRSLETIRLIRKLTESDGILIEGKDGVKELFNEIEDKTEKFIKKNSLMGCVDLCRYASVLGSASEPALELVLRENECNVMSVKAKRVEIYSK